MFIYVYIDSARWIALILGIESEIGAECNRARLSYHRNRETLQTRMIDREIDFTSRREIARSSDGRFDAERSENIFTILINNDNHKNNNNDSNHSANSSSNDSGRYTIIIIYIYTRLFLFTRTIN